MTKAKIVLACLAATVLAGCPKNSNNDVVTRPAQDATQPDSVWLQAELPDSPFGNVYGDGQNSAMRLAEPKTLKLKVLGSDLDGGVRAVRIFHSFVRSTASTQENSGLVSAPAKETTSSANVGEAAQKHLSASLDVDTAALLGGSNDITIRAFAEVENFSGAVLRTGTLTIPLRLVKLRLHVIALSDDGGTHAINVTPADFSIMVGRLNRVFEGTMIRFLFSETQDFERLQSTELNRDGPNQGALGNAFADTNFGKVLILLRWGPDNALTGNSNAYPPPGVPAGHPAAGPIDQRFVAMSGGLQVNVNNFLNLGFGSHFAHELGHYLGLYHTFPGWKLADVYGQLVDSGTLIETQNALVAFAESHGGGINAFDGDRLADTPPDPGDLIYRRMNVDHCTTRPLNIVGVVNGNVRTLSFDPDLSNVMSYFSSCAIDSDRNPLPQRFSNSQIGAMHDALRLPARLHLLR